MHRDSCLAGRIPDSFSLNLFLPDLQTLVADWCWLWWVLSVSGWPQQGDNHVRLWGGRNSPAASYSSSYVALNIQPQPNQSYSPGDQVKLFQGHNQRVSLKHQRESCLLGGQDSPRVKHLSRGTASATAPEIQSVTMQLLFIKCNREIHLAGGSILCPTNRRAFFSSEQMPFFYSFLMLLSFTLANMLMHWDSFSECYGRLLLLKGQEVVPRI